MSPHLLKFSPSTAYILVIRILTLWKTIIISLLSHSQFYNLHQFARNHIISNGIRSREAHADHRPDWMVSSMYVLPSVAKYGDEYTAHKFIRPRTSSTDQVNFCCFCSTSSYCNSTKINWNSFFNYFKDTLLAANIKNFNDLDSSVTFL